MKPPVTEIEFEEILNNISSSSKRERLQTGKILLEEVMERCLANKQNYPELFEKCLEKVLSSKDFVERAAASVSNNSGSRESSSALNTVVRMINEGKSDEEIDKFLLGH